MTEKKLRREVTRKKDGRTLIYYTWEADTSGEEKPLQSAAVQGKDRAAEK